SPGSTPSECGRSSRETARPTARAARGQSMGSRAAAGKSGRGSRGRSKAAAAGSKVSGAGEQGVFRLLNHRHAALTDRVAKRVTGQVVADVIAVGNAH